MTQLLQSAIIFGTVILFGALGEILTEKSGSLNLGVPGIMYLGGIAGLARRLAPEISQGFHRRPPGLEPAQSLPVFRCRKRIPGLATNPVEVLN